MHCCPLVVRLLFALKANNKRTTGRVNREFTPRHQHACSMHASDDAEDCHKHYSLDFS